jgi:hypothetical protein
MDMKIGAVIGTATFVLTSINSAAAQSTLGELVDAGGKQMTKAEVMATVTGATISGPTKVGGEGRYDYGADGSMIGAGKNPQGRPYSLSGKWYVDDSGKWCADFRTPGGPGSSCAYLFKKGDQYYVSDSDSDRSTPVLKRTINK